MKTLITLLLSILPATQALAIECTERSAQVAGVITAKSTDNMTYCRAKIAIREFSAHTLCPLTPEDSAVTRGINFPLQNGHDCEIQVGQEISGVLISNGRDAYID